MALTKISGSILKDPLNLGEVSIGGTLTYQDVTNVDSVGIITARSGINVSGGQLDVGSNIKLGNAGVITATTFSGDPSGTGNINAGILDLKTGGNIRLRFASGGEAQFRGDTNPIASFDRGSANSTNVKWGYLGADRGIISSISNEFRIAASGTIPMTFHSNGSERLRITSTGYIGINTSSPQYPLHVAGHTTDSSPDGIGVLMGLQHNHALIHLNAESDLGCIIDFSTPNNDRKGGILYYHSNNSTVANRDAMQFHTAGAERLRITSAGKIGINNNSPTSQLDGANDLVIGDTSDADSGITLVTTTSGQGLIHFSDATSGNARYDGFIGYEQTNRALKFGTAQAERLRITSGGHVLPAANNTYDLGSTGQGWRNVYMNDLNLSNMKGNTNDVDGTQGSWTIQEGKDDLYIINRLNGKKFKIKMEEIS